MLEEVAKYVHEEMWVKWAKIMLDAEPNISTERRERWEECFIPYEDLRDEVKELDRQFARKIIEITNPVKKPTFYSNIVFVQDCEELGKKHNWCNQFEAPSYCSVCNKGG